MKRVVITGGSAGIGKEINLFLLEKGFHVLFTYHNSSAAAKEIEDQFPNAKAFEIDFSKSEELAAFCTEIKSFNPEILINNFYNGTFIDTYFHKTEARKFLHDFQTNIVPTLLLTQECLQIFRKKKFGRIINILSSSLSSPAIGTSVYNANKAYLLQMNRSWALENVKFGITANSISPAFIPTDFHKNMDERVQENIVAGYPLKEKLQSADIAELINLCINGGKHFNGNHLFLDAAHF